MSLHMTTYMDFECPFSRNLAEALRDVRARAGGRLEQEFRHFPLREIHPHAQAAAEAAEAARAQGRFEAMHDALFAHQRDLSDIRAIAAEVGLDLEAFDRELASGAPAARVEQDVQRGLAEGVDGTPAILIGGERYRGFYDSETLMEEIEFAG
jgi:protein-disulfide isomerase